jgi:protein SCO1/2
LHRLIASLACAAIATAQTSNDVPPQVRNVAIEQKLGSQVPLNLELRDEAGQPFYVRDHLGNRPVVLAFVYYSCPRLCSMTLNGLSQALKAVMMNAGEDFDVWAVSFDPKETPALAVQKKAAYPSGQRWRFLTGDRMAIERLAHATGFKFEQDARTGEFSHASGLILLTPGGKVSKYFYGIEYPAKDLRAAIRDASSRRIGSPVDALLLYCFHYDP